MRPLKTHLRTLILGAFIVTGLSGCAAAVIGGGLAATSMVDRRSAGSMADDEMMELHIKAKAKNILRKSGQQYYSPAISVVSYNRRILLLGQVSSPEERQIIERIARSERSAAAVYNYVHVSPTTRTLADISNDTLITSRVRANMLHIPGVYPGHVKVVTYEGITYVMGMLTPEQQAIVNQRISTTPGVRRVVTLYENYASSLY